MVELNEKLSYCFNYIDKKMIANYRRIKKDYSFEATNFIMNRSMDFNEDYKDDMISEIINHYAENWDVSQEQGRKHSPYFVFKYKGPPAGYASHIVLKDVIIAEKDEPQERTNILDIRP